MRLKTENRAKQKELSKQERDCADFRGFLENEKIATVKIDKIKC